MTATPTLSIRERAQQFIEVLRAAEKHRDPETLVDLFSEDAELRSLLHDEPLVGTDGARKFWTEYLHSFRALETRFEAVHAAGSLALLEWVTHGTLASGQRITYRGVSVLEYEGDRVRSFRTYYDSAALRGGRRAHVSAQA